MSQPTSDSENVDLRRAKAMRRRSNKELSTHFEKHKFKGPKFKLKRAPLLMQINAETPPVVVAMWTYLCVLSLTIGWFTCSLFGYHLCRMWRNVPAPGEGANLEFIFTAQPLNRWAVNLVVSFGMLLFFTSQTILFMWRIAVTNRDKQKKFTEEYKWLDRLEAAEEQSEEGKDRKKRSRDPLKDAAADAKRAMLSQQAAKTHTK